MLTTYYINYLTENWYLFVFLFLIGSTYIFAMVTMFHQTGKIKNDLKRNNDVMRTHGIGDGVATIDSLTGHLTRNSENIYHYAVPLIRNSVIKLSGCEKTLYATDALYSEFTCERVFDLHLSESWFHFLRSFMVALGVVGTFVGLVIGIEGASGGLASTDSAQARMGLEELLKGAGTAFYTSLAGISCATLFNVSYQKRLRTLENVISESQQILISRVTPHNAGHTSNKIRNMLETISKNNNDLADKLENRHSKILELMKKLDESVLSEKTVRIPGMEELVAQTKDVNKNLNNLVDQVQSYDNLDEEHG